MTDNFHQFRDQLPQEYQSRHNDGDVESLFEHFARLQAAG